MNAFAAPFAAAAPPARLRPAAAACPRAPPPFFAAAAFGAPVAARVAPRRDASAAAAAATTTTTRMDVTVVVGDNEPVESALRRFKKDVSKSGHLFELRRRRYFETNTEKRIRKAAAAKRKVKMARNSNKRDGGAAPANSK